MFKIFEQEKVVTVFMLSFFVLGIFLKLLLGYLYQNMINETDNMATTENKLLKQCKLKFSNCYQLNKGMANVPVFVDKFLNRLSLGPLSFMTMYHLSGQTMLLSIVCAGVGICRSIMNGKMLGEILPFYIVSFLGLYLYFSLSTVVDIKGKRRVLKINLVDYLENHLSTRIDVTERDIQMLYGSEFDVQRQAHQERREEKPRRQTVELMPMVGRSSSPSIISMPTERVSEEELEALLKEFLAT